MTDLYFDGAGASTAKIERPIVAAGTYSAIIDKVEERTSKNQNKFLLVTFQLMGGEYDRLLISQSYFPFDPSSEWHELNRQKVARLMLAATGQQSGSLLAMKDRSVTIKVSKTKRKDNGEFQNGVNDVVLKNEMQAPAGIRDSGIPHPGDTL